MNEIYVYNIGGERLVSLSEYEELEARVARLTSIISGMQSTLEYVRAQTLEALDVDWAEYEDEPAEAISKQYWSGLEDIKAILSNV